MASIKFYALCSENMYALKRHQKTIPKTDLMIILNSMNSQFIKEASSYCKKEGIDFKVTKSDRTPATGKNSVLDEFKSSEHDFMVLIDGDDFLTPHGVFTYKQIADMKSPPDVLALECQYGLKAHIENYINVDTSDLIRSNGMGLFKGQDPDSIKPFGDLMMYRHKGTFEKIKGINKFALEREWGLFCTKYISSREPHLRVVMLSKAAAKMFRFDPRFMIGDDTVNYLDYKWAHCQGLIKLAHLFDSEPTYVYDCRCGGVTADKNNDGWMKKLMVEFRKREQEGTVFDKKIPRIKINKDGSLGDSWDITWPEGYIPDVCGLPKPKQHEQYWN